jgi:hypothetical protein
VPTKRAFIFRISKVACHHLSEALPLHVKVHCPFIKTPSLPTPVHVIFDEPLSKPTKQAENKDTSQIPTDTPSPCPLPNTAAALNSKIWFSGWQGSAE